MKMFAGLLLVLLCIPLLAAPTAQGHPDFAALLALPLPHVDSVATLKALHLPFGPVAITHAASGSSTSAATTNTTAAHYKTDKGVVLQAAFLIDTPTLSGARVDGITVDSVVVMKMRTSPDTMIWPFTIPQTPATSMEVTRADFNCTLAGAHTYMLTLGLTLGKPEYLARTIIDINGQVLPANQIVYKDGTLRTLFLMPADYKGDGIQITVSTDTRNDIYYGTFPYAQLVQLD